MSDVAPLSAAVGTGALRGEPLAEVPHVDWDTFIRDHFRWRQGEHLAAIGPTNSGKTTLILALLPYRRYVVFIATKPKDATLDGLRKEGFQVYKKWDPIAPEVSPKRILWPEIKDLGQVVNQRRVILDALKRIYVEGYWCVVVDELWYVINQLKLDLTIRTYLQQARSLGITLVMGTQRPAFVPLEVYDQSTHLFFWRDNDERNLKRLSGIGWLSARLIMRTIAHLEPHEVLYINTRTGLMVRTKAPARKARNET